MAERGARHPENTQEHAVRRHDDGRWAMGASPNPGGRPKGNGEVRELARQYTETALKTLVHIAEHGKQESARVAASQALLDRGWGKASQPLSDEDGGPLVVQI